TAKNTREINRIIGDFSKKKTNILVGTQLVAKGLDFDSVGLVGIISADAILMLKISDNQNHTRNSMALCPVLMSIYIRNIA
ncbi:MAG: hypothetical protein IKF10_08235, partial [Lachnospiraceae bacterium]|nr:hypothetical protein [Lachnospiraceae bacterium]